LPQAKRKGAKVQNLKRKGRKFAQKAFGGGS